jgi:hypothetical protein
VRAALLAGERVSLDPVHEALAIAERLASRPLLVQCLSAAGVALARGPDRVPGLALVRWAQRHPDFARSEREDAERHLIGLTIDPSEEAQALQMLPTDVSLEAALQWFRQHGRA